MPQVFLLEGLGWKNIALMHPGGVEPQNPSLIDHSQLLSFGISVILYLCIVVAQLAYTAFRTSVKLPILGNLESPCDSFMCAPLQPVPTASYQHTSIVPRSCSVSFRD